MTIIQRGTCGCFVRKFERFSKRVDGENECLPPAFLLFYTRAEGLARYFIQEGLALNRVSKMKTQWWSRK